MKSLLLLAALGLAISTARAQESSAILKNGILTVTAGDYQAAFSFGHRWNLSSLTCGNMPIITPGGANQFTLKGVKDGVAAWYGGIGNTEEIEAVTLHVDGEAYPLDPNGPGENRKFNPGETYVVEKVTKLGPYQATIRTTIGPAGLTEDIKFSAIADIDGVDFLYPSRFSFAENFSSWFAILEDAVEEDGQVGAKGGTAVNRWTAGLALYAESNGYVILLRTIEESRDLEPNHFLWSTGKRISFHAKLGPIPKEAGTVSLKRQLSVASVDAASGDWRELLRKNLQEAR